MIKRSGYLVRGVGIAVAMLVSAGPAAAQTKEARGTVTSVAERSVTIKAGADELTFFADHETHLQVLREQKDFEQAKAGSASLKLSDYFTAGTVVLVRYREENGRHHALDIGHVGSTGPGGGGIIVPDKIATGKVKAVTQSQLTLSNNGHDSVYAITNATDVRKKGATAATKAAGGSPTITAFVRPGDTVSISYRETAGHATASEVRVSTATP